VALTQLLGFRDQKRQQNPRLPYAKESQNWGEKVHSCAPI